MAPGLGGISPGAMTGPPVPGAFHAPPLAASPLPKESDLRAIPALLAEPTGVAPQTLAGPSFDAGALPASTPYFLQIAGLPSAPAAASPAPAVPGMPAAMPVTPGTSMAVPLTSGRSVAPAVNPGTPAAVPVAHATPVAAPDLPSAASYAFTPEVVPQGAPASRPFDPYAVRRDFPILQERVHGRPLVWLDNAEATTR